MQLSKKQLTSLKGQLDSKRAFENAIQYASQQAKAKEFDLESIVSGMNKQGSFKALEQFVGEQASQMK